VNLAVHCDTCEKLLGETRTEDVNSPLATAFLALAHFTLPHSASHKLRLLIDGRDLQALDGEHHIELRCLHAQCAHRHDRIASTTAPAWLVSAMAIVFHASHEGHPLQLIVDGKLWWPTTATGTPAPPPSTPVRTAPHRRRRGRRR